MLYTCIHTDTHTHTHLRNGVLPALVLRISELLLFAQPFQLIFIRLFQPVRYSAQGELLGGGRRFLVKMDPSVKRDLLLCQKRPITVSKETYYCVKGTL